MSADVPEAGERDAPAAASRRRAGGPDGGGSDGQDRGRVGADVSAIPFPGLRPFAEDEEHYFFGRESQTDALVDRLAATRFLAIVGSSGSGKSSLVNCGLLVALRAGLFARAGTAWRVAKLRPGGNPIGALARALAADGGPFDAAARPTGMPLEEIVETNLRMSRLGLVDVIAQARLAPGVNVLVVVDQFEELFRYREAGGSVDGEEAQADEEAAAFVELLLAAVRQRELPIHVALTMRSDFLGDCTRFPELAEAINEGLYLVPRMSRDERRIAIAGPVAVTGAECAPVLLTRLVNDLGDDPDQLSVLQHALNRIWARWQQEDGERRLNLAHYSAVGSMAGALDRHAEKAWGELADVRERELCRKLFQALTDASGDPRGVRRPLSLGTLRELTEASEEELTRVIDVFRKPSRSFLMPPADEPLDASTVIDISHESLMRKWRRLRRWTTEEASAMRTYRRLAETARLHARGEAGLWRDPDLQRALDWQREFRPNAAWAARYGGRFDSVAAFLEASAEARDAEREREREEEGRRRELERAQAIAEEQERRIAAQSRVAREQRRVMRLAVGGLVVTGTLLGLFVWQWLSRSAAEASAEQAQASAADAYSTKESVVLTLAEERQLLERERERLAAERAQLAEERVRSGILADALTVHASSGQRRQAVVEVLVASLADEEAKRRAVRRLAETGPLDAPPPLTFENATGERVLLLTLTGEGVETAPRLLEPEARGRLELGGDDVWVARSAVDGRVVAAGVAGADSPVTLSSAAGDSRETGRAGTDVEPASVPAPERRARGRDAGPAPGDAAPARASPDELRPVPRAVGGEVRDRRERTPVAPRAGDPDGPSPLPPDPDRRALGADEPSRPR